MREHGITPWDRLGESPALPESRFSEAFRPRVMDDLLLPEPLITRFNKMLQRASPMDMIFYGSPGRGKTSAARIFIHGFKETYWVREWNGSLVNGDKSFARQVEELACNKSVLGDKTDKIAFIDEADALPKPVQESLRYIIENAVRCRFLMTANDIRKLTPAIKSRLQPVDFDSSVIAIRAGIDKLMSTIPKRLDELGVSYDPERVLEIISTRYPDIRSIVNQIEFEFG